MNKTLIAGLLALPLVLNACTKEVLDTQPHVKDLSLSAITIANPGDKNAFCAGTATLALVFTGQESYFLSGNGTKQFHTLIVSPGTQTQYQGNNRIEPCGAFSVQFREYDQSGQMVGLMDDQCKIHLNRPVQAGFKVLGYASHPGMSQAYPSGNQTFEIQCP